MDRQEQSYQEEQEEESPALRPGEVSSTYFFPRINFCSRDRAGMVSEGGAKPRGNGRTEQCRQRRVGDQPRWRARGASKLLVAVLLACAASGGEGGLNHFKRNGQQTRQKLSHSSIVNTLNKGKVRQMKEAAEMAWDQQLYRHRPRQLLRACPYGRSVLATAHLRDKKECSRCSDACRAPCADSPMRFAPPATPRASMVRRHSYAGGAG